MSAIVAVFVILGIAFAVGGVVAIGLSGILADRFPLAHARFVEVTRHLNGDADAPERVQRLFQH